TKVNCIRTRQKRPQSAKLRTAERIRVMAERLSKIEGFVMNRDDLAYHISQNRALTGEASDHDPAVETRQNESSNTILPLKRKQIEEAFPRRGQPSSRPNEDTAYQTGRARDDIDEELSRSSKLSVEQRMSLEAALSVVHQISGDSPLLPVENGYRSESTPEDLTPSEILHIIMQVLSVKEGGPGFTTTAHLPDHISAEVKERVGTAILENNVEESILLHYRIIMHYKAIRLYHCLYTPNLPHSTLKNHSKMMEARHINAVMCGLHFVDLFTNPSLSLLQAVLCGAILQHANGDINGCWLMTASASRLFVALGYHEITNTAPRDAMDEEIFACLLWCYVLDKETCFILRRPSSLPKLQIGMSRLVPSNFPEDIKFLDVPQQQQQQQQQQGMLIRCEAGFPETPKVTIPEKGGKLVRVVSVRFLFLLTRSLKHPAPRSHTPKSVGWWAMEFKLYATATAILRLNPSSLQDPNLHDGCLSCARKTLKASMTICLGANFPIFELPWARMLTYSKMILSNPLSPFLVIFCNVVRTLHAEDLCLLRKVYDGMSRLDDMSEHVSNVHRIFATLVGLCEPLIPKQTVCQDASRKAINSERPLSGMQGNSDQGGDVYVGNQTCDDDIMWQILRSQPSIDWYKATI
ncbi:hypothetical protein B0J12DRAFT_573159, partial [Macrophomina phaseolina]